MRTYFYKWYRFLLIYRMILNSDKRESQYHSQSNTLLKLKVSLTRSYIKHILISTITIWWRDIFSVSAASCRVFESPFQEARSRFRLQAAHLYIPVLLSIFDLRWDGFSVTARCCTLELCSTMSYFRIFMVGCISSHRKNYDLWFGPRKSESFNKFNAPGENTEALKSDSSKTYQKRSDNNVISRKCIYLKENVART